MHNKYWAGSEDSYDGYLAAIPKAEAMAASYRADSREPDFPPMYERVGTVGVITIEGTTIPGQAGFMRFFGMVGYDDIKAAAYEGVADPEAKTLLIRSVSGGGAVNGVRETVEFLQKVGAVKPLSGYAEFMASAAYWLGSVTSHITVPPTGMVGSIGVLRVMTEYSRAFEKDGVTKKVMRAGEFKALGNPYEPFSQAAIDQAQGQLDYLYKLMVTDISANRGATYILVDTTMAQGREFIGKQAVDIGLADELGSFDNAVAYASKNKRLLKTNAAKFSASATGNVADRAEGDDNTDNTSMETDMHKNLTEAQLAAVAAGIPLAQVLAGEKTQAEKDAEVAAAALKAEADKAAKDAEDAATAAAAQAELLALAKAPVAEGDAPLIALMKTELATANAALAAATTQASALEADQAALKELAAKVIANLGVATGKSIDTTGMSAAQLVEAHTEQTAAFANSFRTGPVAKTTQDTAPTKVAALFSPRDIAAAKSIPVSNRNTR